MDMPTYLPLVNWLDGMKINSRHFIDLENSLISRGYQLFRAVNPGRLYGLLPDAGHGTDFHMAVIPAAGASYTIVVQACRAITAGGALIIVPVRVENEELRPGLELVCQLPIEEGERYVMLQVHPYHRLPAGQVNTAALPYKTDYVMEEVALTVSDRLPDEENRSSLWEVPLARLVLQQGIWRQDVSYIPPCVRLGAYSQLLETALHTTMQLGYIHSCCKLIIQKVYSRQQSQELGLAMLYIAEHLSAILVQYNGWQANILDTIHPFEWYVSLYRLAAAWCAAIDQRAGHMKEELIQYFSEWSDVSPGEIEQTFAAATLAKYRHSDMMAALKPLLTFVELVHKIIQTISQLEYIGKRPDANIFVKEERSAGIVYEKQSKKSRWSFSE